MGNLRQTSDLDFRECPAQLQRGWLSRNGNGDFEIGARYTWASVRSRFTHIALAFDAGFPTGDARKGLGEAAYTVAPSSLVSRELREGKYQIALGPWQPQTFLPNVAATVEVKRAETAQVSLNPPKPSTAP